MSKPYDPYVEQQKRKAEELEAAIRADERERMKRDISWLSKQDAYEVGVLSERDRIIDLIESKDEWHYEFSDVSDIIALIRGES